MVKRENYPLKKQVSGLFIYSACLILFFFKGAFAAQVMDAKWNRLWKLITDEEKTIKSVKNRGPRLQWRLLELETEKLKLIKEKENQSFLTASTKRPKSSYFKESRTLYYKIRKEGLKIIKTWPRFKFIGEIYYTLALNSRDYGGDKETERFLLLSLKKALPRSPIIHNAKVGLAEHYYNGKKYKKAISYYQHVIQNKDDEWYTKHLYNLSWCLIQTKHYDASIVYAKNAFFISKKKDSSYIDVTPQVLESIGYFYVLADRGQEGSEFYIQNVAKPGVYLIKMAKKTAEDRGFESAERIFMAALANSLKNKSREEEIEIRLSLLDFYRDFKKPEQFWEHSIALDRINTQAPLQEEYRTEATEKIRSFVGHLQIRFTRNSKTNIESFSKEQRDRIIQFFDILTRLHTLETDTYRFYQGETLFAINDFPTAFSYYQKALEHNKIKYSTPAFASKDQKVLVAKATTSPTAEELKKQTDLRRKLFDSLLSCLERGKYKKEDRLTNTIYTYENHLSFYPIDSRSQIIYKKLYNLYLKNAKIDDSMRILTTYQKNYPGDQKIQRGMFTQIIDHYIKEKNTDQLAIWIPKLQQGYLGFEKKFVEKATLILGNLLFERYQKYDKEGKKDLAIAGYEELYKNPKYPQSIKAKSAYRASILYLDVFDTQKSLKWMVTALKLFTSKERFERRDQILAVVQSYVYAQDFFSAEYLASNYLNIYCKENFKEKNDLYRASVQYALIKGKKHEAISNYRKGLNCSIEPKVSDEVLKFIGQYFYRHRQMKAFVEYYYEFEKVPSLQKFFDQSFVGIYWHHYLDNDESNVNSTIKFFHRRLKNNGNPTKEKTEMVTILNFRKEFPEFEKTQLTSFPLPQNFKEEDFNQTLENNIAILKSLTEKLSRYIKSGHPLIVTKSYQILGEKYFELAENVSQYTPSNQPQEYVQGFRGAMSEIAKGLYHESQNQKTLAINLLNQNKILSSETGNLFNVPETLIKMKHRHPASLYVIPSDRMEGK